MALAQKLHFSEPILTALQGDLAGRIAVPFLPVLLKSQGSVLTESIQKEMTAAAQQNSKELDW